MNDYGDKKVPGNAALPAELNNDFAIESDTARHGQEHDARDMRRLGRKQEVKRRFRFFSIVGYMVILPSTWEGALQRRHRGHDLDDPHCVPRHADFDSFDGRGKVESLAFMIITDEAQMASISPTAGGQCHWVSEFAPPELQKPLSYAVGWMAALGWQTAMPAVAYTAVIQIIALIATVDADYVIQGWHGALLTIAFVTFAILDYPPVWAFAFVVVLRVTGPRTPGSVTFTTFADEYGWGSPGLAMLVSIVGPAAALIGADAAVHLAEELQDASYVLPCAMITSALINYATAFVTVISLVSAIGPNLEEVLATTTGQPWVEIVRLATGSQTATIVLVVLVCFQYTFTSIDQVDSRNNVPQNAVIITLCTTIIVSLNIIGSSIAFNIILSICNVSLIASYLICIATFLAKRIR
nr:hypothetical protein B0A51_12024 [Rachicladosporium sp. CCFEE 5018]